MLKVDGVWQYGDAGDRFPVELGDIWEVGPHVFACGDLELGHAAKLLTYAGVPDVVYTDPPWNKGNARAFRTKAGDSRAVDFLGSLLPAILSVVKGVEHAAIEMGNFHADDLRWLITSKGGVVLADWKITYYRKNPSRLLHCTFTGEPPLVDSCDGMDDDDTPQWFLERVASKGCVVFDPCMGRGLTSRVADDLGMKALGMELHPRRLAVSIDRLVDRGYKATKIGAL